MMSNDMIGQIANIASAVVEFIAAMMILSVLWQHDELRISKRKHFAKRLAIVPFWSGVIALTFGSALTFWILAFGVDTDMMPFAQASRNVGVSMMFYGGMVLFWRGFWSPELKRSGSVWRIICNMIDRLPG